MTSRIIEYTYHFHIEMETFRIKLDSFMLTLDFRDQSELFRIYYENEFFLR